MDARLRGDIVDEIVRLDVILKASESWAKSYNKDPKTHAELIKNEAKFQQALRVFFTDIARQAVTHVNWSEYEQHLAEVKAARVDAAKINIKTIISGDLFDTEDGTFMKVAFNYLSTSLLLGSTAGEKIYGIKVGLTSTSDIIQKLATDQLASLVGKQVDKDGNIVDNPNADYRISDKTREQIAGSIKESLDLGEDRQAASLRLIDMVSDPSRAETIAQTESVNAYGSGLHQYGIESGATGKEWQYIGDLADEVCAQNEANSPIAIDDSFQDNAGNDIDAPAAHPNCRCGMRLLYANEFSPDN